MHVGLCQSAVQHATPKEGAGRGYRSANEGTAQGSATRPNWTHVGLIQLAKTQSNNHSFSAERVDK
jgi:hypothetical protein